MKIAIVEFDYHYLDLYNTIKLFENSSHEISIFTKQDIYNRFLHEPVILKINWVLKNKETIFKFLQANTTLLNSHDIIYFNTIASNYYAILKTEFHVPTILRIHNSHTYLCPTRFLYFPKSKFELFKAISYIIREMIPNLDFIYIPKLLKKLDRMCFPDYDVENYVLEQKLIKQDKIFTHFPAATCFSLSNNTDNKIRPLEICIPGFIDGRKRDYTLVIKSIEKCIANSKNEINLCLAGKPIGNYGKKVIENFKKLENNKFKVKYFDNFISQNEYDNILMHSDIIIAPLVAESSFRIYKEIYGKSKTSGSFLEMIRYGKLIFLPQYFYTNPMLTTLIEKYDSCNSLATAITKYAGDREYFKARTSKLQNYLLENYSPSKVIKQFEINCAEYFSINKPANS
jgi:hypothetical protein